MRHKMNYSITQLPVTSRRPYPCPNLRAQLTELSRKQISSRVGGPATPSFEGVFCTAHLLAQCVWARAR